METTVDFSLAERLAGDPHRVGVALRAFYAIADRWGLKADDARRLLGSPSESTYFEWKRKPPSSLSPDSMVRISYLLGMAALLERLFATAPERANAWVSQPNSGPLTEGSTALEYMLDGGLVAMDELFGQLQSDAGFGSPSRASSSSSKRVYA